MGNIKKVSEAGHTEVEFAGYYSMESGEVNYVRSNGNTVVIGNDFVERKIRADGCLRSEQFLNKLTKKAFLLRSDEFAIGLANDSVTLTTVDFTVAGPPREETLTDKGKKLTFRLHNQQHGVDVEVMYEVSSGDFYMRKQIMVRAGAQRVASIEVERMNVPGTVLSAMPTNAGNCILRKPPLVGVNSDKPPMWSYEIGLGFPIFLDNELFLGLEHPAGHNFYDGQSESETIHLLHYPWQDGDVVSQKAVLGVAPNTPKNRAGDWLLKYIRRERHAPFRMYTLVGTKRWVDGFWSFLFRDLDPMVALPMSSLEEFEAHPFTKDLRNRAKVLKEMFVDRCVPIHGALLDSAVDVRADSLAVISGKQADCEYLRRFGQVARLLKQETGADIGGYCNNPGTYMAHPKHLEWLAKHYDMAFYNPNASGDAHRAITCLADPQAFRDFRDTLVYFIRKYGITSYYFDMGGFACEMGDHHGHMPGYGTEAITNNYLKTMQAIRDVRPDVFLCNAGWYSPWWLLNYDAVYVGGQLGDFNGPLLGPPCFDACAFHRLCTDASISVRVREHPFFPICGIMEHSFSSHPDWGNWGAHPSPALKPMTDQFLMGYLSGAPMKQYYTDLSILTKDQKDAHAGIYKWASANEDLLLPTGCFIGGDPMKGEVYGYGHFNQENHGIIGIRNPHIEAKSFSVKLDETSDMYPSAKPHIVEIIYPYRKVLEQRFSYDDEVRLDLSSHQLVVMTVTPEDKITWPKIVGMQYEIFDRNSTQTVVRLLNVCCEMSDNRQMALIGPAEAKIVKIEGGSVLPGARGIQLSAREEFKNALANTSAPEERQTQVLGEPRITTETGSVSASFAINIPTQVDEAKLVIYYRGLSAWEQREDVTCRLSVNGKSTPMEKFVNASREKEAGYWKPQQNEEAWALFDATLAPGENRVELQLAPERVSGNCEFSCLLLTQRALDQAALVTIEHPAISENSESELPAYWQRKKHETITIVTPIKVRLAVSEKG